MVGAVRRLSASNDSERPQDDQQDDDSAEANPNIHDILLLAAENGGGARRVPFQRALGFSSAQAKNASANAEPTTRTVNPSPSIALRQLPNVSSITDPPPAPGAVLPQIGRVRR